WIQDRVPDELEVIRVVRAVALALAEAHESGIVHRDLKPANILMNRHGDPVVTDFGLALSTNAELSARLTQPGLIVGSPAYMSPEQIRDASNVGPRSDVYSLGIVMYQMLTGTLPYTGEVMTVIRKIALEQPTPPKTHRPELSEATNAVCLQAIAKEESQRFQSMSDFAAALRQSVRTTSGKSSGKVSRNRYFAVIALGLLAATIILSLLIEPERKPTREDRSVSSGAQNTVDWDQEASMGEKMEGLQYWLDLGLRLEDENDHGIEEPILEFPTSVGGVGTLQMREIDVDELRELFQLFPDAKKLSLRADDFSDIAWKVIAEHEPRHLYIIADELMPEAFPAISEMKYLKWLELDCASVKDEDVEVLASLTQLESLLLSNTQVTGKCFPLLAGMESITNLEFADSQIQDEYLSGLKYFPNLKQVSFSNNPIDGSGLSGLAENKNLVKLDFTDTPLKDRYLESLRGLDALQSLKLKKCSDIRDLSGLEGLSLKFIDISGTNVEDIRPLTTMLIEHIYIDLTPKQDETLLRSIKSLRLINDIPIENDAAENESS
ncbi:MAG: protein kinase, partial [Planctomycetota bacterium]